MSIKAIYHTKHLPDEDVHLPSSTRFVLMMLADFANEDDEAWPNYATLEHYTGLNRSTVIRAVNELVERGLLERITRYRESGSQTSNTYRLTFLPDGPLSVTRTRTRTRGGTTPPRGGTTPPPGRTMPPLELPDIPHVTKTPPTPPTPTPPAPQHREDDDGGPRPAAADPEVEHAMRFAERRRATSNAGSLLSQQHPRVWAAFSDLQSIYTWKPPQFAAIAEQLLTLAREHTDTRVETACRAVIETGATITHPIAYIRKLLTANEHTTNPISRTANLPDISTWTLD